MLLYWRSPPRFASLCKTFPLPRVDEVTEPSLAGRGGGHRAARGWDRDRDEGRGPELPVSPVLATSVAQVGP